MVGSTLLLAAPLAGADASVASESQESWLYFTRNDGQLNDSAILYYGQFGSMAIGIGVGFLEVTLLGGLDPNATGTNSALDGRSFRMEFEGANTVSPSGEGELSFQSNFIWGSNASLWTTGVGNFRSVAFAGLYDNVDLSVEALPSGITYVFHVGAGANLSTVNLNFNGTSAVFLDGFGGVVIETPVSSVSEEAPRSLQGNDDVLCAFSLSGLSGQGFICSGQDPLADFNVSVAVRPTSPRLPTGFSGATENSEPAALVSQAYFTPNVGQIPNEAIEYFVDLGSLKAGFADDAVWYVLSAGPSSNGTVSEGTQPLEELSNATAVNITFAAIELQFDGATAASPSPGGLLSHYSNFLLGPSPENWSTEVPHYSDLVYSGLYDGIDLAFQLTDEGLKYEWRISPGADPSLIRVNVSGSDGLSLDGEGGLIIASTAGNLTDSPPVALHQNGLVPECSFRLLGNRSYGFDCTSYRSSEPLVIDPLIYSAVLSGSFYPTAGLALRIDGENNTYVGGWTRAGDFPTTPGAYDRQIGITPVCGPSGSCGGAPSVDGFVSKLSPDGRTLRFSTFIGGTYDDVLTSIALDSDGNILVAGYTWSTNFPVTSGALQNASAGLSDAFVAKLNPAGTALLYSTYVGGSSDDLVGREDLEVDGGGATYLTGHTFSTDFPATSGAVNTGDAGRIYGDSDVFALKILENGSTFAYSAIFGGWANDLGRGIAVDASGSLFVTGQTYSVDYTGPPGGTHRAFPVTSGAYDTDPDGGSDAFVVKISSNGSAMQFSTLLGGYRRGDAVGYLTVSGHDSGEGIIAFADGSSLVVGQTASPDFPTTDGALDRTCGSDGNCSAETCGGCSPSYAWEGFATKLNANGTALVFSTLLGGVGSDAILSVGLNASGEIVVVGTTSSADFPTTPDAVDGSGAGDDAFVAMISSTGQSLDYSTYLGGRFGPDFAYSVGVSGDDRVALVGHAAFSGGNIYCAQPAWAGYPVTLGAVGTHTVGATTYANVGQYVCDATFVTSMRVGADTAPQILAASPVGYEGTPFPLNATFTDAESDPVFARFDLDGDGTFDWADSTPQFMLFGGDDFRGNVTLNVSEFMGLSDEAVIAYEVRNVAPRFLVSNGTSTLGTAYELSAYFTDPGFDDPAGRYREDFNASISWGDGQTENLTVLETSGRYGVLTQGTISAAHVYEDGGNFSASLTVCDDDEGCTTHQFTVTVRTYSTFLGGGVHDQATDIVLDASGNAYVTGYTNSGNFPTAFAFRNQLWGGDDVFVTKINANGTGLVYSTYIGGDTFDGGTSIRVDPTGAAYVFGNTASTNFPTTTGAFDRSANGNTDAFVLKLSATGGSLVYSSYIGGSASDAVVDGGIDADGNAYAYGQTVSSNFPSTTTRLGPPDSLGYLDLFIAKLNATGASLIFSTVVGGSSSDMPTDLALLNGTEPVLVGSTSSSDFPVSSGAADTTLGGFSDGFIVHLADNGSAILSATFLGGSTSAFFAGGAWDTINAVVVDSSGYLLVGGETQARDFPVTANALQWIPNPFGGAFFAKLDPASGTPILSSRIGRLDSIEAIAVDEAGRIYVTGETSSSDFPVTPEAPDQTFAGGDCFVTSLRPDGQSIILSTFLGGASSEQCPAIAVRPGGVAFVAGTTYSSDFQTTPWAFDPTYNSGSDAFVAMIDMVLSTRTTAPAVLSVQAVPASTCEGDVLAMSTVAADAQGGPLNFSFDFDGNGVWDVNSSAPSSTYAYGDNGTFSAAVRAHDGALSGVGYANVSVCNRPPVAWIQTPDGTAVVPVGTDVTLRGGFSDPGFLDTHTATWTASSSNYTYTAAGLVNESLGNGDATANITFNRTGVYDVVFLVRDDDGDEAATSWTSDYVGVMVVVYDPTGGFVTGGGWFDSPADATDLWVGGKATFGFTSGYKKGANVPSGDTRFRFAAGDIDFHSDDYQWLVVAGARAQYKGNGTLNGVAGYTFLLTVIDGQISGGGGADQIRVKILDAYGTVVYDNKRDSSDSSDDGTQLGGGTITIHKA